MHVTHEPGSRVDGRREQTARVCDCTYIFYMSHTGFNPII